MNNGTDCTAKIVDAAVEMLGDSLPRIDIHALARDLAAVSRGCAAGRITEREALIFARVFSAAHATKAWCAEVCRP